MSPRSEAKPIRVAVVDDHELLREGVRTALGLCEDIEVVAEGGTGADALDIAERLRPDVLLLDYRLPDTNAAEVIERLRHSGSGVKLLVFTGFDERRLVKRAVEAGADGYVTKASTSGTALCDAVRSVARGLSAISPDALAALHGEITGPGGATMAELTDRELEILRLAAMGKSNAEIAEELFITVRTVKYHVGNVLAKTGSRTRAEAIARAYQCGLMLEGS